MAPRPVPGNPDDVIGYVRCSTKAQAESGLGLAAQVEAIEDACARNGWNLVAIERDAGKSGKAMTNRAGLARAVARIEAGEAGAIVAAKLDRLSRSVADFAN